MTDVVTQAAIADHLEGLTPFLAAGRVTGDVSTITTGSTATITANDRNVRATMSVQAMIQVAPDANLVLVKAKAGNGVIVFTVKNTGAGSATGGNTTIAYIVTA